MLKVKVKKTKNNKKEESAITLIALVITIIVLLILSGVAIATLTGENGILTQVGKAKTKTEEQGALEKVKIAIMGSYEANGTVGGYGKNSSSIKLDYARLEDNLKAIDGFEKMSENGEIKEDSFPIIVKVDGKNIIIESGGTCKVWNFDANTLTIGTAINTDKYGWKVTNYNVKETETGGWRLFFQDDNYAYLISDDCTENYIPSDYYAPYTNGSFVGTVGRKLNPKIRSLFTESNTYNNIRMTAWLTDTSDASMWAKYKNDDAVFAIRESDSGIICSIL